MKGQWYVRAIESPTHLEKELFNLRGTLVSEGKLKAYPPLPFIPTAFSPIPFEEKVSKTLYFEDRLGEGGLVMDRLLSLDGLIYWSSSRLEDLLSQELSLTGRESMEGVFRSSVGFLLGEEIPSSSFDCILKKKVNWKKGRIRDYLVDFSPLRAPGEPVDWPRAVRWS